MAISIWQTSRVVRRMDESAVSRAMRGEELLAEGRYAEGFRLYDAWREVLPDVAAEWPIPAWRGEDLAGCGFLIGGEQGFGDQIMFARFAKLLQARGADVVWYCKEPMARLLSQCAGIRAITGGSADVAFYCQSSRLPNLFFPPLLAPPAAPYIEPPPPQIIGDFSVGVVTSGNPKHVNDANRSLTSEAAETLMRIPGAVSLQPQDTGAQDFYDTAAIIAGLDLVISVDTSVAHLAGAMGKPVWVLLPHAAEWRWMRGRSDSPWYPSARLFRQQSPGDWPGVIDAVLSELKA